MKRRIERYIGRRTRQFARQDIQNLDRAFVVKRRQLLKRLDVGPDLRIDARRSGVDGAPVNDTHTKEAQVLQRISDRALFSEPFHGEARRRLHVADVAPFRLLKLVVSRGGKSSILAEVFEGRAHQLRRVPGHSLPLSALHQLELQRIAPRIEDQCTFHVRFDAP